MNKKNTGKSFCIFSEEEVKKAIKEQCNYEKEVQEVILSKLTNLAGRSFTVDRFGTVFSKEMENLHFEHPDISGRLHPSEIVGLARIMMPPEHAEKVCLQLGEHLYPRNYGLKNLDSNLKN